MDFPIVVLISGRGSNMLRLIDCQGSYRVAAVISNSPDAGGLELANQRKISTIAVGRSYFDSAAEQKKEIFNQLQKIAPRLIVLAGYMQILEPYFIEAFRGRIINIHPSLLPKYPGLDTHARALAAGDRKHGCSVHIVDTGVDTGTVIAQAELTVREHSTAESLAAEVQKLEHQLYPWVVQQIATNRIKLSAGTISYEPAIYTEAARLGFKIMN
jgi:phosphoribosylglycinamide formyltransferase-1